MSIGLLIETGKSLTKFQSDIVSVDPQALAGRMRQRQAGKMVRFRAKLNSRLMVARRRLSRLGWGLNDQSQKVSLRKGRWTNGAIRLGYKKEQTKNGTLPKGDDPGWSIYK